jgi:hypothetical protein
MKLCQSSLTSVGDMSDFAIVTSKRIKIFQFLGWAFPSSVDEG